MLTCRISVLPDTGWILEQGQRVRVHLGTAEVLARAALLEEEVLGGGEEGWVQLRLEEPILARGRDHLVIRSYSPVTTMGGGRVVEALPPKRRHLRGILPGLLAKRLSQDPADSLEALLEERGWAGVSRKRLPQRTGLSPGILDHALEILLQDGRALTAEENVFSGPVVEAGEGRIVDTLEGFHHANPLRGGLSLEELRQSFPSNTGSGLPDALIRRLTDGGVLAVEGGLVRLSGFMPRLTPEQEDLRRRVRTILEDSGLSPPGMDDLARELAADAAQLQDILRFMESEGELLALEGALFFWKPHVQAAGERVVESLAGKEELGPADFRDVLGVTRKYLLPLLRYMDTVGVTTRRGDQRNVAKSIPGAWGTS